MPIGAISIGALIVLAIVFGVMGQLNKSSNANMGTPTPLQSIVEPSGVQTYPSEGREHVSVGTRVIYKTDPPTSGAHYEAPLAPKFYDSEMPKEAIVHNLEHGHIAIYYDPEKAEAGDLDKIKSLTKKYNGYWDAVIAFPKPNSEKPFILTAWTKMLELERYDEEQVNAFVDAYRGRGPENPVR